MAVGELRRRAVLLPGAACPSSRCERGACEELTPASLQTMDNADGKQARRTGTSSPMGELFDHGCDALNSASSSFSVFCLC